MAKKKQRNDITISEQEGTATWQMHAQGEINGTYMGLFKFRCYLSPTQKLSAGRDYRDLIGAHPELATEDEKFLAYALAQLKHRIISAPPFWAASEVAGDLPDEAVITKVLEAAIDAQAMFKDVKTKSKEVALGRAKKAAEKILNEAAEAKEDESASEKGSD